MQLDDDEPGQTRIVQDGRAERLDSRPWVPPPTLGDDGDDDGGQISDHLVEDRIRELLERREALVEVTPGEPGFGTDVLDPRAGDTPGAEELQARGHEAGPTRGDPVGG